MVFQVPPSKASTGQDGFKFKIGDKEFSARKAKFINVDRLAELEDDGTALLAFFKGNSETQAAAVGALDREQFTALVTAWRNDSEVTSGESQASGS